MPTYEYQCENCEHFFEQFQSITSNPLKKCPRCGKMKLNRLIGTGAGIIFKGSGFYETDYRSKSYTESASKEISPAKTESSSSDKKEAPAKTETKKEPTPSASAKSKKNKE